LIINRKSHQLWNDGLTAHLEKETTEIVDENSPDVGVSDRDGKVSDIAVCSDKEYRIKAIVNVNEGSIIPLVDGTFDPEVVNTSMRKLILSRK
jgi:hypothetical protein